MTERFTGDTGPGNTHWNAVWTSLRGFLEKSRPAPAPNSSNAGFFRKHLLPRHSSNTFVAIGTETGISLLKTWVSADTVKNVLVSRKCRFVWQ